MDGSQFDRLFDDGEQFAVGGIGAAVILAIDGDHVILVEQYRVPLAARCLELPAGLVGDEEEGEAVETALAGGSGVIGQPIQMSRPKART